MREQARRWPQPTASPARSRTARGSKRPRTMDRARRVHCCGAASILPCSLRVRKARTGGGAMRASRTARIRNAAAGGTAGTRRGAGEGDRRAGRDAIAIRDRGRAGPYPGGAEDRARGRARSRRRRPYANPISLLALDIAQRLTHGGLDDRATEALIQRLTREAFLARARTAREYLGELDPARNAERVRRHWRASPTTGRAAASPSRPSTAASSASTTASSSPRTRRSAGPWSCSGCSPPPRSRRPRPRLPLAARQAQASRGASRQPRTALRPTSTSPRNTPSR